MKELDGFGFNDKNEANCQNQFDSKINGAIYGAVVCDDKPTIAKEPKFNLFPN